MALALDGTKSAAHGIDRVHYSHDAMIDLIIANPAIKQFEIAKHFGVTGPWVSRVVNSDAFTARLAARKADVIDPILIANMQDKLMGLMDQSVEVIADKLEAGKSPDLALKALELTSKALGYGARKDNIAVQNNFVVALPSKEANASAWAAAYTPERAVTGLVEDAKLVVGPSKELLAMAEAAGV